MEVTQKIPLTLEGRLAYGEEMRLPASWDEFLEWLPICPYRIEYNGGEIISYMGFASVNHEQLALTIARLLAAFLGSEAYQFFGSNLALHIPGQARRYFNADCAVVKGATEQVPLKGQMKAVANPILLVEVLSPSTLAYDLSEKFEHYRKIPSLQQVLFIDSTRVHVISQTRMADGQDWRLHETHALTDHIAVLEEGDLSLANLYHGISFD